MVCTTARCVTSSTAAPRSVGSKMLRNQRVAITRRGGGLEFGLRLLHEHYGLVYGRDTVVVELATAQNQLNGLVAGAVDAAFVWIPANFLAERRVSPSSKTRSSTTSPSPTNSIAVRRPYLATNEDIVRRYLQGHIEAVELTRRDKELTKRVLAQNTATDDEDILERSYTIYVQDLQDTPSPGCRRSRAYSTALPPRRPGARTARTRGGLLRRPPGPRARAERVYSECAGRLDLAPRRSAPTTARTDSPPPGARDVAQRTASGDDHCQRSDQPFRAPGQSPRAIASGIAKDRGRRAVHPGVHVGLARVQELEA